MEALVQYDNDLSYKIRREVFHLLSKANKDHSKMEILNLLKKNFNSLLVSNPGIPDVQKINDDIIRIQKYSNGLNDKYIREFLEEKKNRNFELLKIVRK